MSLPEVPPATLDALGGSRGQDRYLALDTSTARPSVYTQLTRGDQQFLQRAEQLHASVAASRSLKSRVHRDYEVACPELEARPKAIIYMRSPCPASISLMRFPLTAVFVFMSVDALHTRRQIVSRPSYNSIRVKRNSGESS